MPGDGQGKADRSALCPPDFRYGSPITCVVINGGQRTQGCEDQLWLDLESLKGMSVI